MITKAAQRPNHPPSSTAPQKPKGKGGDNEMMSAADAGKLVLANTPAMTSLKGQKWFTVDVDAGTGAARLNPPGGAVPFTVTMDPKGKVPNEPAVAAGGGTSQMQLVPHGAGSANVATDGPVKYKVTMNPKDKRANDPVIAANAANSKNELFQNDSPASGQRSVNLD